LQNLHDGDVSQPALEQEIHQTASKLQGLLAALLGHRGELGLIGAMGCWGCHGLFSHVLHHLTGTPWT